MRRAVVAISLRSAADAVPFAIRLPLLLIALLYPMAARADPLVGDWYSEGTENGQYLQILEHRRDDGTFTVAIRVIEACKPAGTFVETGSWQYADGSLKKHTHTVGIRVVPDVEYYHDSFLVTRIDRDHIELLDAKTHVTWKVSRVPPEFTFPQPASCLNS